MNISEIEPSKADAARRVFQEATNTRTKIWIEGLVVTDRISPDLYDTKSEGGGMGHLGLWTAEISDVSDAGLVLDEPQPPHPRRWLYLGILLLALSAVFMRRVLFRHRRTGIHRLLR